MGNTASGGWAGYAFPVLRTAIKEYKNAGAIPYIRPILRFDGNVAHSTAGSTIHSIRLESTRSV